MSEGSIRRRPGKPAPAKDAAGSDQVQALTRELEMMKLILDSIHNGVMVTDAEGYVTHFNKPYGQFLGFDPEAQIGRHCTEVIENTRMHLVARTGVPEINQPHRIKGQDMVVQRIPIKKDGKVIAVFGQVMFKDVRDVRKLADRLSLLESKVEFYEKELTSLRATRYTFDSIFARHPAMIALKEEAWRAAAANLPVLITGESGTGKEVFAQAIHQASPRRRHPFVRINCAVIPKDLLESELFGYEKGAFTGAGSGGKPGKFELAHHGTVFLDEIGDLPLEMQPKLLRVLEEREFERVGGTVLMRTDFRLISATNQNLSVMLSDGRFRKDLFYRLSVAPLHIPPLRERREEIVPLAYHLLHRIAEDSAGRMVRVSARAEKTLRDHDWPGNVRELLNVLERAVSSLAGEIIDVTDLPFYLYPHQPEASAQDTLPLKKIGFQAEKEAILHALKASGNNKSRAAGLLGIHRTLLYKKMKKHNLVLQPSRS
ncbi:MAG: sigma 54-interacting transcriptional regulator [Thermodesulfobacteriota bacterium]